jgi:putative DNA primase/helicase
LPDGYFLLSKNQSTDFVTANLQGIRLASCIETNDGRRLDVAKIKTITGEDKVTAALKYQNYFEFQPQCKLVLATNYLPHAAAGDDAFWRRSKILPFTATVPEQKRIPDLAIKLLRKEGPGILNWALAGFATWQSIGLQEPPEITAAVNDYRSGEDTIREFVDECCELDFDPDSAWRVSRKELYTEYLKWSKESNIRPMSKKRLSLELQRLGVHGDDGDRFWLGLRIRGAFE